MSTSSTTAPTLIVMAKSPVSGRVKTRCTPPCTPDEAAQLAAAALHDTLQMARCVPARRHILALDGPVGEWLPDGFEVVEQAGRGLGERLDRVFADAAGPALMIGMDTPQVTTELLRDGLDALTAGEHAVVGLASDGGFWTAGLRRPWPGLFAAVPMSRDDTGHRLLVELAGRGLDPVLLPVLVDVDDFATAVDVAARIPGSRFATTVDAIRLHLTAGAARR